MSTLCTGEKAHQQVLPQLAALESLSADTVGVTTKRDREVRVSRARTAGAQHGRGETQHSRRCGVARHGVPASAGTPVLGGSDPATQRNIVTFTHPRVFVLDKHEQPLMPCHPARARQLLKNGRARVVRLYPFTIRLIDRSVAESTVNGVTVKIDPGSKATGISVSRTDAQGNLHGLVAVEVRHRGAVIHQKLHDRAALRRGRRSRNLRYRAPRFDNRTKPQGWLPPSLRHRVDNITSWVTRLRKLAPVTAVVTELVRFDTQALDNPEISGTEYQQGTLAGYEVREYLLAKWNRRCAYCDATDVPLNIDHIRARSRGGSNRVSNLALACVPCNQRKDNLPVQRFVTEPERLQQILATAKRPLRDAAAVNATRWELLRQLQKTGLPVTTGTGGRTKWNRTRFGLPKSHCLDALVVGEVTSVVSAPRSLLMVTSTGRGSYARTRSDQYGFPRLILTRQKQHHGYATGDLVRAVVPAGKKAGTHLGRVAVRKTGSFNITTVHGTVQGIGHRHCRLLQRGDGWNYQLREEESVEATSPSQRGVSSPA